MRTDRILFASFVLGSAALLAGCSTTNPSGTTETSVPNVVTTTTQLADFTTELLGSPDTVTSLIEGGESAHGFDPSAADLQALAQADVLVINGAGLEAWLDDVIDASGFDGVTIDASSDVHVHTVAEASGGEDHAHEEDAAAEGDHDGHDHGGTDPHIWTDPVNAIAMVETIANGLVDAAPDAAQTIEEHSEAYLAELQELDAWVTESIQQVPEAERLLVTNHNTFAYLAEAHGITVVGAVMPSFDDNAEVGAQQIDELVAAIEETGAQAVFSETSLDPSLAETIANEAGVRVFSGDAALYADSLGVEGTPGDTYIDSQIHNVSLMVESWGAEPAPLPSDLETS